MVFESKKISAILFDMDGVLVDSRSVIERAWREAADMYGVSITEDDIHTHIHGQPGPHTIRALFGHLPLIDQQKVQTHIIHSENTAECVPVPGVAKFVGRLSAAGIPLGIVTSGWRYKIDRVIASLNAQSCFSVIVERDDVERGKPFPDPYLLAAERLGLPPAETLVFEDAISGVTAAVTAGARCVGIGGDELLACGAEFVVPDFSAIETFTYAGAQTVISFTQDHTLYIERK